MKRKVGWIALVVLTLLLGWMWRPVAAQLKYAALSIAQTFTALQTFSGGLNAEAESNFGRATDLDISNETVVIQSEETGNTRALTLYRNWNVVNAGSSLGLAANDSAGNPTTYSSLGNVIVDATDGAERGKINWAVRNGASFPVVGEIDYLGNLSLLTAGATVDGKNLDNAAMEDEANVFTLANRFSAGAFADAGQQIGFEGSAGDTYQKRDADLSSLESSLDGVRGWSLIGGVLQPPPCPADLNAAPPGFCHDEATGDIVLVGTLRTHP